MRNLLVKPQVGIRGAFLDGPNLVKEFHLFPYVERCSISKVVLLTPRLPGRFSLASYNFIPILRYNAGFVSPATQ